MKYDYSKLRGKIYEKYRSASNLADTWGISRQALSYKLNGIRPFSQDEIYELSVMLEIEKPDIPDYFFMPKSSENITKV